VRLQLAGRATARRGWASLRSPPPTSTVASSAAAIGFLPSVIPRDVIHTRHFHFSPSILLQTHKALGVTPAKGPSALYGQCWRRCHGSQVDNDWCGRGVLDLLCDWLPVLIRRIEE